MGLFQCFDIGPFSVNASYLSKGTSHSLMKRCSSLVQKCRVSCNLRSG